MKVTVLPSLILQCSFSLYVDLFLTYVIFLLSEKLNIRHIGEWCQYNEEFDVGVFQNT